jgi:hypothetical protein
MQTKIAQLTQDVEKKTKISLSFSSKLSEMEQTNKNVDFPNSLKEVLYQLNAEYLDNLKRLEVIEKL